MPVYRSRYSLLPGTSYEEVISAARKEHEKIRKLTPRRNVYVRSSYFNKSKIFIAPLFWDHIMQKNIEKRTRRLRLYNAAIDLMRKSRCEPYTIIKNGEYLHRFDGITKDGVAFSVQIKQEKKSGRLDFMSAFPRKSA